MKIRRISAYLEFVGLCVTGEWGRFTVILVLKQVGRVGVVHEVCIAVTSRKQGRWRVLIGRIDLGVLGRGRRRRRWRRSVVRMRLVLLLTWHVAYARQLARLARVVGVCALVGRGLFEWVVQTLFNRRVQIVEWVLNQGERLTRGRVLLRGQHSKSLLLFCMNSSTVGTQQQSWFELLLECKVSIHRLSLTSLYLSSRKKWFEIIQFKTKKFFRKPTYFRCRFSERPRRRSNCIWSCLLTSCSCTKCKRTGWRPWQGGWPHQSQCLDHDVAELVDVSAVFSRDAVLPVHVGAYGRLRERPTANLRIGRHFDAILHVFDEVAENDAACGRVGVEKDVEFRLICNAVDLFGEIRFVQKKSASTDGWRAKVYSVSKNYFIQDGVWRWLPSDSQARLALHLNHDIWRALARENLPKITDKDLTDIYIDLQSNENVQIKHYKSDDRPETRALQFCMSSVSYYLTWLKDADRLEMQASNQF